MKNAIEDHNVSCRTDIWVVIGTKFSSPVASRLFVRPLLCAPPVHTSGGVIAAVRQDLHSQRVPVRAVPDGLAGRAIALDVIISTTSTRGFVLRILLICV